MYSLDNIGETRFLFGFLDRTYSINNSNSIKLFACTTFRNRFLCTGVIHHSGLRYEHVVGIKRNCTT